MSNKLHIMVGVLAMLLLLLGGCQDTDEQATEGGSWQGLSQCSPSLSVTGNTASCGLFVRGMSFDGRIGADLRLQRLEDGAYKTIRLWYGLEGWGELDFADRCWLNEAGSYRLSAQVWVDELEPVVLYADLKLAAAPPQRPDGEELAYENVALFEFELPENGVELEIWEEILATAQTEADRYYNAAPGLLLRVNNGNNNDEIVLPLTVLERLAAALEQGELRQLAIALPLGRVCFLDGGQSLRELINDIENISENSAEINAGLEIGLAATESGGWDFALSEAVSGAELQLADDGLLNDVLVYGELTGERLAAWEKSAARTPSERMEMPLYADLVVLHQGKPVAVADIVYGINGDTEGRAYARILTRDCGEYQVGEAVEYARGRWYGDYLTYLAGRGVIEPEDFAPKRALSRGELAALLYRLAGEPERYTQLIYRVDGAEELAAWDAEEAGEYAKAIGWTVNRGIMTGFADGSFRLEETISKQELLVMLWRYVERAGTCLPHNREDIRYFDRGSISGFAREAVSAFSEAGLAPREDWRRLAPTKRVTQAEAVKLTALVNQSVLNGLEKFVLK